LLASETIPSASDFMLPAADFKPADLQLRPVQTLAGALTVTYLD
jgi:hypothetical protein